MINGHRPLCIEFIFDPDKGIYFGWGLTREKINPYAIPLWDFPEHSLAVLQWISDGTLAERVNEEVLRIFRESLSKDIPENCNYKLYKYGLPDVYFEGVLKPVFNQT